MSKKKSDIPDPLQIPIKEIVPIVAIGASAGGIDAMTDLLRQLSPTTGFAFFYIQHVDPSVDTQVDTILKQVTAMPVLAAEPHMPVKANHLYILPPDKDLEVINGLFMAVLSRFPENPLIHMPVDQFFVSLAERQKEASIGVVLSGTTPDGTMGLRAIKVAGGITFAQDETAQYQSMPRSAIVEGVVDQVLAPTELARELERLSQQVALFQETTLIENQEDDLSLDKEILDRTELSIGTDEDLRNIIQLLRRAIGVDFSHYKTTTIRRRIIRRMLLYKLETLKEYTNYLRQRPAEASLLYDDLLINVTNFFRDADTMDYLQKVLLPLLVRDKDDREPLRIWIPACSTGQEAYSIAMLLLEVLAEQGSSLTIQLFATDLSESAVAKARLGSYTKSEVIDVSPRRLQRFFTKVDDHYRINKSVRDLCVFAPHNLLKDPPFSRLDLVSCRNLLIYLDATLQRKAIATFHYALKANGYLVLGKSETVGNSTSLFSQVEKNYKIFARKNDVDSRATFAMSPRGIETERGAVRPPIFSKTAGTGMGISNERGAMSTGISDVDKIMDTFLLSQYVPASVLVNHDLEILQSRGSTGLFLELPAGKASLNLVKMARPSLAFELRNIVHKAQKSGESVRKGGLEIRIKNKIHFVSIEAVPLITASEDRLFLIVFEEEEPPAPPQNRSADARNSRIKELENELANLREDMRSIIEEQEASNEELQSANEEIISSNEELQSINEELETSKEEIESTNEELLTINQELQVRNDQLSEAYQFAEDIFGTIREATMVLDSDLRVKSANQAFYRMFRLTEDATLRHLLYELAGRQWDIPQLRSMLTDLVTSDAQFQGFELTYSAPDVGTKTLSLNARRVVRQQEAILLVIEDITESRRAQRLVEERQAWFQQIADNAPTLIWVTDAEGKYTYLNKVWLDFTGRTLDDVVKSGWAQGIHPNDRVQYQLTHAEHIVEQKPSRSEYRLLRRNGDYRWMLENAQPMFSPDGTFSGYIGSSADVHLQKELTQELDRLVQERTEEVGNANRELTSTNLLLQSILDAVPTSVVLLTPERNAIGRVVDFVYQSINRQPGLITDNGSPEGQPRRMSEIYPAAIVNRLLEQYSKLLDVESNKPLWDELMYPPLEKGAVRYLLVCAVRSGPNIVQTALDITALRNAEAAVLHNVSFLNKAQAIANFGSYEFRYDTKQITASEEMYRMFGLDPQQDVISIDFIDSISHPDDIVSIWAQIERASQDKQDFGYIRRIYGQNNEIRYLSVQNEVICEGDKVIKLVGVAQDITEQTKTQEHIQQTAINLQAVLDSSPAAIGFFKAVRNGNAQITDFTLFVCNNEFSQLVGFPLDKLLGQSVKVMSKALWQTNTFATILQVKETGLPFYEERYNAQNDQWTNIKLVMYDDGVVLTGVDITALKKAEQQQEYWLNELEKSNENKQALTQLRHQLRERGEFLRSTSHDLRGNFGVIEGAAQLLTMNHTDFERTQLLAMLQRNVQQASHMLTDLLSYARLEAGQEQLQLASFDAAVLMQELSNSVLPLANERALWVKTDGPTSLIVVNDAVKVRRIGQNLILNSLKYTQQGGVLIGWGTNPGLNEWWVRITDTGPGLGEKTTRRLLDETDIPDQATVVSTSSGEGIGLLIVKRLCLLLGARISLDKPESKGTVITIHIPLIEPN